MRKILFILVIIATLSSCRKTYAPLEEVQMTAANYEFSKDTTTFDCLVKIEGQRYYFYRLDNKELYAIVDVPTLVRESVNDTLTGSIICFAFIVIIMLGGMSSEQ